MTHSELDPQFVQGLRLLHSSNKDSMDQLRTLLDEAIKQKHGLSKMLCNVLHKKYTMEEPVLSDHSSTSSKKSKSSSSSSKHSHKSNKSDSPEEIIARDTPPDMLVSDDPLAEILEDDLTCVVCKGMDVGARNRLVECADCHALYHQECHVPLILDSQIDSKLLWYCSNCIKVHQPVKDKVTPKAPVGETKKESKKTTSSSKHSDKYKGSSSHSVITTDSSSSKLTPNINIISGDRRIKDTSKKSKGEKRSGSTSSSSKYSSSSSSTKSSEKSSRKND